MTVDRICELIIWLYDNRDKWLAEGTDALNVDTRKIYDLLRAQGFYSGKSNMKDAENVIRSYVKVVCHFSGKRK